MLTLVVARYNEDVSWVNLIPANVVIVNKSMIGNTGREAASYLWFIVNHYESLQGDYLFCQGDPFAHCGEFDWRVAQLGKGESSSNGESNQSSVISHQYFGARLTCDRNGAPHHPGLQIGLCADGLHIALPEQIEFTAGAQFIRSADEIRRTSKFTYQVALQAAESFDNGPWIFERLWDYLIPQQKTEM